MENENNNNSKAWELIKPLATAAITNYYDRQNIKEQNEFNAEEAEKQRQYETEMSNTAYQRAYEDMRKAGLNPNLAGGSGGASTPSGSAATSSGVAKYDLAGAINANANAATIQAQIDNMNADTDLKEKQSGKTETEQKAIEIETEIKQAKLPFEIALANAQTKEQETQAKKNLAEYNNKVKELNKLDAEIAILKEQGKYVKAQTKMQERLTKGIQTREWINTISNAIGQIGGVATQATAVGQKAITTFAM